jgi:hypothetical protein
VNQTFMLWKRDCDDPRVHALVEAARALASEPEPAQGL